MITRQVSNDVVRASDPVEEVTVETADISSKFKFFETYRAPEMKKKTFRITPPREGQLKVDTTLWCASVNPLIALLVVVPKFVSLPWEISQ